MKKKLRVAIVCDSLVQYGGAERVVDGLHTLYPDAPIYTLFYDRDRMTKHGFDDSTMKIITPRFGKNKLLCKIERPFIIFYPTFIESFDLKEYDLVISSSSRISHGVVTALGTTHICYMHTPTRYAWDYFAYRQTVKIPFFLQLLYPFMVSYLRIWDRVAADRVDYFIANSEFTKKRIRKFYRKDAQVIHPFVDIKRFLGDDVAPSNAYVYIGRFIPWRKLEFVIHCFNKNGLSLKLIGNGSATYIQKLKSMAHANITFYEHQTDHEVVQHIKSAKGLIWPSQEDFGIVPIEFQAAGKPIIAFNAGGTIDSIEPGVTGILFDEQTPQSLQQAIAIFEKTKWNEAVCKDNAKRYTKEKFLKHMEQYITYILDESSTVL